MRNFTKPAALLALSLIAGCTQAASGGNPYPPVPPLIAEPLPKPPVTGEALMWQPGHWDWNGGGYVWARGQYVPARGHGNLWVPGWWSRSDAGWSWQPAHWTS
jgi:WXXGXW repeat (2 copies)